MKKTVILGLILVLTLQLALAGSIDVSKRDLGSIVVSELNDSANFEFVIKNNDAVQFAEFYSFVGVKFNPSDKFNLSVGENVIRVQAWPGESYRSAGGLYNFEYVIIPQYSPSVKDTMLMKIVKLKDIIKVESEDIHVGESYAKIRIKNDENVTINNLELSFSSQFFTDTKSVTLGPMETKEIRLDVNGEKIDELVTGSYEFVVKAKTDKGEIQFKGTFDYVPKEDSKITRSAEGFIIRKTTYTRTNLGNTPILGKIEFEKDVLSRLFTVSSVEPVNVERRALVAKYSYERNLKPGEELSVTTTTNYTIPVILVLLVVIVALLVKLYYRTNVLINKRVNFVKARGGEFALKVTVHIKAKKYVENVEIIDRLPGVTQLYEKFGIRPDRIDSASKRLMWKIERLNVGEERIFSYIVYSKVNVVGRFELPSATATYQRDGVSENVVSNRTFFVAEQTRIR